MTSINQPTSLQQSSLEQLPDELLTTIFTQLDPFQRARQLSTCKKWKDLILLNFRFWQYLRIQEGTPISLTKTILSVFRARSSSRLKDVEIQQCINTTEDLAWILTELQFSADTLKVIVLIQDLEFNQITRVAIGRLVPKVHTLVVTSNFTPNLTEYLNWNKDRFGIGDSDNEDAKEKTGLKCYHTQELGPLLEDEKNRFSNLTYFKADQTMSIDTLWEFLSLTPGLVELVLDDWKSQEEVFKGLLRLQSRAKGKIRIKTLEELVLPDSLDAISGISQILDIDEQKTMLVGNSSVLNLLVARDIKFTKFSLRIMNQDFLSENPLKDLVTAYQREPKILFQAHRSIEDLVLVCPLNPSHQVQEFFNEFFKVCVDRAFETVWQGQLLRIEEKEDPNQIQKFPLLPWLTRLTIRNPDGLTELDGKLLKNLIQKRRQQNQEFRFQFQNEFSQVIEIDDWEERGWMGKTPDC